MRRQMGLRRVRGDVSSGGALVAAFARKALEDHLDRGVRVNLAAGVPDCFLDAQQASWRELLRGFGEQVSLPPQTARSRGRDRCFRAGRRRRGGARAAVRSGFPASLAQSNTSRPEIDTSPPAGSARMRASVFLRISRQLDSMSCSARSAEPSARRTAAATSSWSVRPVLRGWRGRARPRGTRSGFPGSASAASAAGRAGATR